jgi:spore coat polysaccharide biosynthesis protein SpsF
MNSEAGSEHGVNLAREQTAFDRKRIIAVVQSRMGSHRFPGKAMAKLGGVPLIELVLRRVRRSKRLTEVALGTSERSEDEVLCELARSLQLSVVKGPEQDVLARFGLAAKLLGADVVVRICGDSPLVAPEEIDRVVEHHLRTGADYSFNHIPAMGNGYPDGLGAEVVERAVLDRLDRICIEPAHREHVTAYIWDHPEEFHIEVVSAPPSIVGQDIKLDVDEPRDLTHLEQMVSSVQSDLEKWSAEAIVQAYRSVYPRAGTSDH